MSLFKSFYLFLQYKLFVKSHHIKIAITDFEKEQIYKFRYQIYRKELAHSFLDELEVTNNMLFDEYDNDANTVSFYSGDVNHITGTIRISCWPSKQLPEKIQAKYSIPISVIENTNAIGEIRFFQVRKDQRNSSLGLMLLFHLYHFFGMHPKLTSDVYFCDCQPGLVPGLLKIGYYPYTSEMIYKGYGILQVPLVLPTFDLNYLKKNHCDYYFIAKYYFNIYKKKIATTIANNSKDISVILPPVSLTLSKDKMASYREQFPNDMLKKHYDLLLHLLDFHFIIPLKANTTVIKKDIVDYDVFFILSGNLQVSINDKAIAYLTPGMLVGEIALINHDHKRSAIITALNEAEILLIPRGLLNKLMKEDPKKANNFLMMLCQNLSDKLIQSNQYHKNCKRF